MKFLRYIFCVSAVAAIFNSCGKDGVIPEDDFAEIYAEMLLIDQWVLSKPGVRSVADTSLVYEPILNKYGYTSEDYRTSMVTYMNTPEEYGKILSETMKILEARLEKLEVIRTEEEKKEELQKFKDKLVEDIEVDVEKSFSYLFKQEETEPDTLIFLPDTLSLKYKWEDYPEPEIVYDGIKIVSKEND